MICSKCNYRKHIPLYSKCAGVAGRAKVGTAFYCGHPEMKNPVPVIPEDVSVPEDCPVSKTVLNTSESIQRSQITG